MQGTRKTLEGAQHPDRDAQFRYISSLAAEFISAGEPVISVDTKKKELVGRFAQGKHSDLPAGSLAHAGFALAVVTFSSR